MAKRETLEYVELNAAGATVSLFDLNDERFFFLKSESFKVLPGVKTPVLAQNNRRWGGSREVGETTESGHIEWEAGVSGATEQACIEKVEKLLAQLEANPYKEFVLWQPPGATHPTLYDVRGAATWTPAYEWAQFEGAQLFMFQVQIPVGPLAQGLPVKVLSSASTILPAAFTITGVPGDAPAKAEVTIETGEEPTNAFITGQHETYAVAVDSTHIYWSNVLTKTIGRATIAGGSVEPEWIKLASFASGIAVDSGHVYWTQAFGKTIGRATIAGGSVEESWIASAKEPSGIAVDSGHVYWTNSANPTLGRATIAGGSVEPEWIKGLSGLPYGIAINNEHVYWANYSHSAIGRATIGGGEVIQEYVTGAHSPLAVAVDAEYIYWAGETGLIGRCTLGGKEAGTYLSTGVVMSGLAVTSSHIYWTTSSLNEIGRGAVTGSPPIFALLGWASTPSAGLAAAPFGVLDSSEAEDLQGWTYEAFIGARGGKALVGEIKPGHSTWASWSVDPATMAPDSFSGEIAIEVWARVAAPAVENEVNYTLSAQPQDGVGYGSPRYTDEWGSEGHTITEVEPVGGSRYRFIRLGTLHLLVNPLAPRVWKLVLDTRCPGGLTSIDETAIDYLVAVPVLQRACSPSAKANNASYPQFISNVAPTVKTIKSDLSATVAKPGKFGHPDHGLGGQLLEIPAGSSELFIKLSSLVPDDPAIGSSSEQLSHEANVTVVVTPRYFLARTA